MPSKLSAAPLILFCVVTSAMSRGDGDENTTPKSANGVVRSAQSGVPLAGVRLLCIEGSSIVQTTTDPKGEFTLAPLTPGRHEIQAVVGRSTPRLVKVVNIVAGRKSAPVDIVIEESGTITGTITDSNGAAVADMPVLLLAREYHFGLLKYSIVVGATTNDQGEYVLEPAEPQYPYLVLAAKRSFSLAPISDEPLNPKKRRLVYAPTFYPSGDSPDGALLIMIHAGERRERIDIRLLTSPSYCLQTSFHAAFGTSSISFSLEDLQLAGGGGNGASFAAPPSGLASSDKPIRVCGLHDGLYRLVAQEHPAAPTGTVNYFGSTEVLLSKKDAVVNNIDLRPRRGLRGDVTWDGAAPPKPPDWSLHLYLEPESRYAFMGESNYAATTIPGDFVLPTLFLDSYVLTIGTLPGGYYVKDAQYGGESVLHSALRIGSRTADDVLRVRIASDGGELAVSLIGEDEKAVPDAYIYILPNDAQTEESVGALLISGRADQDGTFCVNGLRPGKYYVMASTARIPLTPEGARAIWLLRGKGEVVDVSNARRARVTLHVVG